MGVEEDYQDIITGVEPKYKSNNKYIQRILIKLFGYKIKTEKKWCKKIDINKDDYFNIGESKWMC